MALSQTLGTDLNSLAKHLQSRGRGKDTILAHINPKEAMRLKLAGGSGSINPQTGLLEFDDTGDLSPVQVTPENPAFTSAPVADYTAAPPEQHTVTGTTPSTTGLEGPNISFAPSSVNAAPLPITSQAAPAAPIAAAPVAPQPVQAAPAAPQTGGNVPQPTARPDVNVPDQSADSGVGGFLNNNKSLLELGGLGALGLYGGMNSAKAAGQAQQLQTNLANIAAPISAQGNAALAGVQTGALTPANEQALQAAQAQTAQGQRAGAVSSQQAAQAVSTTFATLLNNQLNQALQLLNTADTYLQQAYLSGYQANIANQTNTQNFYANLAQLAARMGGVAGPTATGGANG